MEMNINDEVWVKLTKAGKETYKKHFGQSRLKPLPLKETLDGWSKFQMWELMNYFGNECYNGSLPQFEKGILRFTPPN
jgi:hypothetical protein